MQSTHLDTVPLCVYAFALYDRALVCGYPYGLEFELATVIGISITGVECTFGAPVVGGVPCFHITTTAFATEFTKFFNFIFACLLFHRGPLTARHFTVV